MIYASLPVASFFRSQFLFLPEGRGSCPCRGSAYSPPPCVPLAGCDENPVNRRCAHASKGLLPRRTAVRLSSSGTGARRNTLQLTHRFRRRPFTALTYECGRTDLYGCVILRNLHLSRPGGHVAMITMQNWIVTPAIDPVSTGQFSQIEFACSGRVRAESTGVRVRRDGGTTRLKRRSTSCTFSRSRTGTAHCARSLVW